jgi:hypothetical protein
MDTYKNTFPEKITTSNDLAKTITTALCDGYADERPDLVNRITKMIDQLIDYKLKENIPRG